MCTLKHGVFLIRNARTSSSLFATNVFRGARKHLIASLSIVRFTNLTPIEAVGCCLACCNMAVKQRDTEDGRTHTIEINVCREWCRRRESREREQAIEEVKSGRKR